MVEQRDTAPEKDVYQVEVYLIEEPSLDALLHDARGTHPYVLVACDRLRLLYGAFESVRDERERRSFVNPLLWDRAAENKDRHVQRVFATPPVGDVERPSTEHQRPCRFARLFEELGGLCRDHEDHVGSRQPVFGVASGVPGQEPLATDSHRCFWAVIRPTYEPVKRDGEPCADFAHALLLPRSIICSRLASRNLGVVTGKLWTTKSEGSAATVPESQCRPK